MVKTVSSARRRALSRSGAVVALTLFVGACAANGPQISSIERDPISYRGPETPNPTRGITPVSVSATPGGVREVIVNSLTLAGFDVEERPERNLIVATFQGPPDRYIDCGRINMRGISPRPAAQRTLTVSARDPGNVVLERTLDLYARATIEIENIGGATRVDPEVSYVVVKNVDATTLAGQRVSSNPEVISFTSDSSGRFSIGTTCVSKGNLEASISETVNAAFRSQPVAIASTRSPIQEPDVCVNGERAAYCDLVDFVLQREWRDDVGVAMLGGVQQVEEGDQVVLDIEAPADLPIIRVSYVDVSGQVVNLRPVTLAGGLRRSAFVTRAEVAPPFGEEMVVVVAGADPGLNEARPFTESLESFADYLDRLNTDAGNDVALNFVTVTTQPSS